jgi:decaprenylphospho-beta-D-erythro-pentofuranosid-2-ulose 2-reductase
LIVGATSGIAEAVARRYAEQGARLFLVGRNAAKLEAVAADLLVRGATDVRRYVLDITEHDAIPTMVETVWKEYGAVDMALIAHGTLPDQQRTEIEFPYAISQFRINAESVIVCLAALALPFQRQGRGVLAVIGSVAGDRGRASNYLYGAAKAAIETYTSGLRARLHRYGVHVLLIKPGFVTTSMTASLNLPPLLTATPARVAKDICKAIDGRRKDVIYTPWFWQPAMLIIRLLPQRIMKHLSI